MLLNVGKFNPFAGTHRPCAVTPAMMAGQPLPLQFPFLYDAETERVHEPTFSYFRSLGLGQAWQSNGRHRTPLATQAAYAVVQFTDLLSEVGREWDGADAALFRVFGDRLLSRVNERTGENLSSDYMARVASYVARAYEHTNRRWTNVELDAGWVIDALSDDDLDTAANATRFGVRTRQRLRRRAMTEAQWLSVAVELGPLVTTGWTSGMRSMRPRLAAETALQTGVRVAEDAAILRSEVMSIPWDGSLTGHVALTLLTTKGGRLRDVALPCLTLAAMRHYHATERAAAMEMRRARMGDGFFDPPQLFVHGPETGVHAGNPVSTAALQGEFRRAVLAADLIDEIEVEMSDGSVRVYVVPLFSYHSLRHTFAIWTYHLRKHVLKIDAEPWKYISARLGHSGLGVTLDVYLDVGRMLEPEIGSLLRGVFLAALDWEHRG